MAAAPGARRRRALACLGTALLTMSLLTACVWSGPPPPVICVPELEVSPSVAAPGTSVMVTTSRACDVEAPAEGWTVRVQPGDAQKPSTTAIAHPDDDGRFSIPFAIPDDMPAGPATAWIVNWWDVAECPDNASCAQAGGSFTIEQDISRCLPYDLQVTPAIAWRGQTLTITAPSQGCDSPVIRKFFDDVVYRIELSYLDGRTVASVDATLEPDGSLRAELVVPDDAPLGRAWLSVANYLDIVPCPWNADCGGGPLTYIQIVG